MKRTPLTRKTPMRRGGLLARSSSTFKPKPRKDPVTPEMWTAIMRRDGGCVAPLLSEDIDLCRDRCGHAVDRLLADLTLEHVQDGGTGSMGLRAKSDPDHLVTICRWHHIDTGWVLGHKPILRFYLRMIALYPDPQEAARKAREMEALS